MAFFNTKEQRYAPRPIPPIPPYNPPIPPTPPIPEEGGTPDIPTPSFTGNVLLTLYVNESDPNVLEKDISNGRSFTISFKDDVSAINPVIVLDCGNANISDYNYCYINYTNRYYYIENKEMIPGNLWRLTLSTDVLMSFKESIKNLSGILERSAVTEITNADYPDDRFYINGRQIQVLKTGYSISSRGEWVLITVGKPAT